MKQRIVLYGISAYFNYIFYSMRPCYDIVGIVDKDCNKGLSFANKLCCKYISPDDLNSIDYDILYVTARLERYPDILRELVYERNLDRKKIHFYKEFYKEREFSFGELNHDKTIYVLRIQPAMGGIVTMMCGFTGRLVGLPESIEIYVDLMNYTNVYLEEGELGKVNAWEKWFEQPCGLSAQEVYNSKHVILCGIEDYSLQYKQFYNNYELERKYSAIFKRYVFLNETMKKLLEEERKHLKFDGSKTCAVIFRGTDYVLLKTYNHHIQPTIEEMIEKVHELKEQWGFEKIYFSTEDAKAQRTFLKEFREDVIYSERELIEEYPLKEAKTYSKTDKSALTNVTFDRENDAFYKGLEYLRQAILASECDYIISGNTGGYWGTLLMSEGFKERYTFELGRYGIDDDSYATAWGHYILIKEEKEKEKQRMEEYKARCKQTEG